jgi:hypothetical protein
MKSVETKEWIIKTYNKAELCELYGLTRKQLNAWLDSIEGLGPMIGKCYNIRQVKMIFREMGHPAEMGRTFVA